MHNVLPHKFNVASSSANRLPIAHSSLEKELSDPQIFSPNNAHASPVWCEDVSAHCLHLPVSMRRSKDVTADPHQLRGRSTLAWRSKVEPWRNDNCSLEVQICHTVVRTHSPIHSRTHCIVTGPSSSPSRGRHLATGPSRAGLQLRQSGD